MQVRKLKTVTVRLLDVQVDIILDALMLRMEQVNEKYHYRRIAETKTENIEISEIRDTWFMFNEIRKNSLVNDNSDNTNEIRKIS